MKIYIASKITGLENYKELFDAKQKELEAQGHIIMNPAAFGSACPGFEHHEYMQVCYAMIDVCEGVHFFGDWTKSKGAMMEFKYAHQRGKTITQTNKIPKQ